MYEDSPENESWGSRFAHFFRERQVYLRSDGQVHFVTIRPWVQIMAAILVLVATSWVVFASVNVAFKDQIIAAKKLKYHRMQMAYEDQIAAMSANVNQLNGRLLLNQDSYEAKLNAFKREQSKLEERQELIERLMQQGFGLRMADSKGGAGPVAQSRAVAKAGADGDRLIVTFEQRRPVEAQSRLKGAERSGKKRESHLRVSKTILSIDDELSRMQKKLKHAHEIQTNVLVSLESRSAAQVRRAAKLVTSLGFNAERLYADSSYNRTGVGGPFVSLGKDIKFVMDADEERVARIRENLAKTATLRRELQSMPVAVPLKMKLKVNSPFGPRHDPFRRTYAMHTGIDYGAKWGSPVHSTANGKIVRAGWMGGYGRVIEILHAHGIITRYAHLSRIDVSVGDSVRKNDIVGRVGSSGRSTGPHLHYETRVDGRAVNPNKFMRAGRYVF